MPYRTEHYNLEALTWGETYSASADDRRFTIIDNQLAFLSDRVGHGVIDGWDITNNGDGTVTISPGIGFAPIVSLDIPTVYRVIQTFGEFDLTLDSNTVVNLYMRNKVGQDSALGSNSNISSVEGIDTVAPSSPSGLIQVTDLIAYIASLSSYDEDFLAYIKRLLGLNHEDDEIVLIPYKQLAFSWDANTESDFSYYLIERATDLEYGVFEELGATTELIYVDIDLAQNLDYIYRVTSVDYSGNHSEPSEVFLSTDIDIRKPAPPLFVQAFPSNEKVEVIWDHSPSENVDSYSVGVQPLNNDYEDTGSATTSIISVISGDSFDSTYAIFENLDNNTKYRITVFAITISGYTSDGISINTELKYVAGAGEINDLQVEFELSDFENIGLETDLVWRYQQNDPYLSFADRFLVTFIENGKRTSDPIEVLTSVAEMDNCPDGEDDNGTCYNLHVKYIPYNVSGNIEYESIKEYAPYIIIVQTADEDNNVSSGIIKRINRTPVSEILPPIANFSIDRKNDNSLYLSWENPTEGYFSYNFITITITNLAEALFDPSTFEEIVYVNNLRIGRSESYVIPPSQFDVNYRYDIEIDSYDVFDTQGQGYQTLTQFTEEEDRILPSPPSNLILTAGDTEVYMKWSENEEEKKDIEYYKVYRAGFGLYLMASNFVVVGTILSSSVDFTDYTVTNGISYSYLVTSVDIYGNETLNPVDDNYLPSYISSATPSSMSDLSSPENLSVSGGSNVQDAQLTWDATAGIFDGYEILRSDGNNYSFEVVGYTRVSEVSYIDEDALVKDGETYCYIVRKFRNGVSFYTTESLVVPSSSIFIGSITTSDGTSTVTIDTTDIRNLANFEDPIIEDTNELLDIHNHKNENGIDKRIELRANVFITNWSTSNYQSYSTTEDIEGADNFILQISGSLNEDYFKDVNGNIDVGSYRQAQSGESPVLYEVDSDKGILTFNESLYVVCEEDTESLVVVECPKVPYTAPPSIILGLIGISEVDNYLEENHIEELSATQVISGQIAEEQMPIVRHEGRINENLIPIKLPMQTLDNYVYSLAAQYEGDRNKMGTALTFYDIIETDIDNQILAATSSGVWISYNYGNDWIKRVSFPTAVCRLYRSSAGDYYALTNYSVFKNSGESFLSWSPMGGLDGVKIVRDIDEDGEGNLYVSTDLGVFRLNGEFKPYIEDTWEKLSIFGPRSSEAYAIIYDSSYSDSLGSSGRILVSNELGLLESTDEGLSWNYITELESLVKIRRFKEHNGYIFALADNAIYREKIGTNQFVNIGELDATCARCFEIFNDTIYVTTDIGPKASDGTDIYTSTGVLFNIVWPDLNINEAVVPVHALNLIESNLLIGADRRLFVLDIDDNLWLQYEQRSTVVPMFFVDGNIQKVGFYYNNGGSDHNVCFDEITDNTLLIEVSNKYDIYFAEYGGWSQTKYDAKFKVYQNNIYIGESRDLVEVDVNNYIDVTLPTYTDNNAHEVKADEYQTQLIVDMATLSAVTSETDRDDVVDMVRSVYQDFELFLSQLYTTVKTDFILPVIDTDIIEKTQSVSNLGVVQENERSIYYSINLEKGTNYATSVNIVDGMFVFGLPFDRYDNLTIDIVGVSLNNSGDNTHRDLEDSFEYAYSGLPSMLSQVQQINISKLGIFVEKHWPGKQAVLSTPVQMESIIPVDDEWYDTLNSTVNYNVEVSNGTEGLILNYPSKVFYVEDVNKIFVGGKGGALSIDESALDMGVLGIGDIGDNFVRDIFRYNDDMFIVTDNKIYLSEDFGVSWFEYNRSGLPNQIYSMGAVSGNIIVGASDGVYTRSSSLEDADWELSMASSHAVDVILTSNIIFAVINNTIHISSNGYSFSDTGVGDTLDITKMERFGYTTAYISTNQGLYTDNGTFNGPNPSVRKLDLVNLLGTGETVNDVTTNNTSKVAIAISDGTYGILEGDVLRIKEFTSLDSIHKILFVDDSIWLFGQGVFKVPYLDYPVKLSTGVPL